MDALVLPLALLSVLCLPAVVAALICVDEMIDRVTERLAARQRARRRHRSIDRLAPAGPTLAVNLPTFGTGHVPIERLAAELRRLAAQRRQLGSTSLLWQTAFAEAYDERLRLACGSLGIEQHLGELTDFDLDIERVRIEGELAAAGLPLPAATAGSQREQR